MTPELKGWIKQMASYLVQTWGIERSFASDVSLFFLYLSAYGLSPIITSGYRSAEKQEELSKRYSSGDSSVVVKPAKKSKHLQGLAIDISTSNPARSAQIATALKIGAGYYFKTPDPVHFYKI